MAALADRIEAALDERPDRVDPLGGGAAGQVVRVDMPDGRRLVAKLAGAGGRLDLEGWMLKLLATRSELPVPAVHHAAPDLLIMDFIEGGGRIDGPAEERCTTCAASASGSSATR